VDNALFQSPKQNKHAAVTHNYKEMRKLNPWSFLFLIIIVFVYLAYNNFEIPTLFIGKINKVEGKIIEINIDNGIRGRGYIQHINYTYEVEGKRYYDKLKVGKSKGWQHIGNSVVIEYSVKNPSKNRIEKFINNRTKENEKTFRCNTSEGYNEIKLNNGIFNLRKLGKKGITIERKIGDYNQIEDTITLTIFENEQTKTTKDAIRFVVRKDSCSAITLQDVKTGEEYK